MADNKILKDELLDDEQLDQVAGGTYAETFDDMDFFTKYCGVPFTGSASKKRETLRDLFAANGIKIKDHGGIFNDEANEYYLINADGSRTEVTRNYALGYASAIINQKKAAGLPYM